MSGQNLAPSRFLDQLDSEDTRESRERHLTHRRWRFFMRRKLPSFLQGQGRQGLTSGPVAESADIGCRITPQPDLRRRLAYQDLGKEGWEGWDQRQRGGD